jgi:hypothetical protein
MLVKDPCFNVLSIKHHVTIFDVNKNERKFAMGRVAAHLLLWLQEGMVMRPPLYCGRGWSLCHTSPTIGPFIVFLNIKLNGVCHNTIGQNVTLH